MHKREKIQDAFAIVKDEAGMLLNDHDLFPPGSTGTPPLHIKHITYTWKPNGMFHIALTVGHVEELGDDERPVNGLRPHKSARTLGRAFARALGANPEAIIGNFRHDLGESTEIPILEKLSPKRDKGLFSTTYELDINASQFSSETINRILREKELADRIKEQLHATMAHTTPLSQFGVGNGRTPLLFLFDSKEAAQHEIRNLRLDVQKAGFAGDLDAFIPEQAEEVTVKGVGKKWELGIHVRGQQEGLEVLEKALSARVAHKHGLDTEPASKAKAALLKLLIDLGIKVQHSVEKAAVRVDQSGDIAVQVLMPPADDVPAYKKRIEFLKEKLAGSVGDLLEVKNGNATLTLQNTSDMGQVQYLLRLATKLNELHTNIEKEYSPKICAALSALCRTAGFTPLREQNDEAFLENEKMGEYVIPVRKITDEQKSQLLKTIEEASSRMKGRIRIETTGGMTAIYLSRMFLPKEPGEKPDAMGFEDLLGALREAALHMPSLTSGGRRIGEDKKPQE